MNGMSGLPASLRARLVAVLTRCSTARPDNGADLLGVSNNGVNASHVTQYDDGTTLDVKRADLVSWVTANAWAIDERFVPTVLTARPE